MNEEWLLNECCPEDDYNVWFFEAYIDDPEFWFIYIVTEKTAPEGIELTLTTAKTDDTPAKNHVANIKVDGEELTDGKITVDANSTVEITCIPSAAAVTGAKYAVLKDGETIVAKSEKVGTDKVATISLTVGEEDVSYTLEAANGELKVVDNGPLSLAVVSEVENGIGTLTPPANDAVINKLADWLTTDLGDEVTVVEATATGEGLLDPARDFISAADSITVSVRGLEVMLDTNGDDDLDGYYSVTIDGVVVGKYASGDKVDLRGTLKGNYFTLLDGSDNKYWTKKAHGDDGQVTSNGTEQVNVVHVSSNCTFYPVKDAQYFTMPGGNVVIKSNYYKYQYVGNNMNTDTAGVKANGNYAQPYGYTAPGGSAVGVTTLGSVSANNSGLNGGVTAYAVDRDGKKLSDVTITQPVTRGTGASQRWVIEMPAYDIKFTDGSSTASLTVNGTPVEVNADTTIPVPTDGSWGNYVTVVNEDGEYQKYNDKAFEDNTDPSKPAYITIENLKKVEVTDGEYAIVTGYYKAHWENTIDTSHTPNKGNIYAVAGETVELRYAEDAASDAGEEVQFTGEVSVRDTADLYNEKPEVAVDVIGDLVSFTMPAYDVDVKDGVYEITIDGVKTKTGPGGQLIFSRMEDVGKYALVWSLDENGARSYYKMYSSNKKLSATNSTNTNRYISIAGLTGTTEAKFNIAKDLETVIAEGNLYVETGYYQVSFASGGTVTDTTVSFVDANGTGSFTEKSTTEAAFALDSNHFKIGSVLTITTGVDSAFTLP